MTDLLPSTSIHTDKVLDKHCMIDIETLGSNPSSPVIQIGLVYFTRQGITLQSQVSIDFDDALKYGEVDGSTIKFWLEQPKISQESLFVNQKPMKEAMEAIVKLIDGQNANFYWAHATFDFPIIQSLCRKLGIKYPLPYKRCLDLRTLEMLAGYPKWEERKGIHHNALADAVYQAEHAIMLLNMLNRG